jgi:quercetin dioxygenase-like cupin family protein
MAMDFPSSAHTSIMAIPHAPSGQAIDVQPFGERLSSEKSVALFKSEGLEVMRVVLLAGKSLPPHSVPGGITVQCIEGSIDVTAEGESHVLRAGQLLFLLGNVTHGVTALEDASALVTVVLQKQPLDADPPGLSGA